MGDAQLTPDGEKVLYLAKFERGYDLWSYAHRKQEVKLLAKLNGERVGALKLDKEGKKAYLLVDRSLRTVDVESGEAKPVAMSASFELDAAAERDYMFEHVWRQTLKKFHDVDMHGVDWDYYKAEYKKFLPYIDTNWDFAELLSEMLGELNASHTGSGYRPQRDGDATASLGFFPDPEWGEPGIRILEILDKSPLIQDGTKIAAGTVITAIDGHEIAAGENWYPLLNRKAGETVRLTLEGEAGNTWEEKVKPISFRQERQLLYERWEKTRRAEVERLSGGRLGYTHLRAMVDTTFREIFEDIFGDGVTKEALVLDTRFNGGGNLDEAMTVFLSGEVLMTATPRGREIATVPDNRWSKPSIIIQNEGNYSDGHCVPAGYRGLGLGEIVGMQVPGTCTSVWWETLQDRSLYFGIPEVTWLDINGVVMENTHFDPYHEIEKDPQVEAAGRDRQLEKAVEVLLEQLGAGEGE
jgi:C-terminal processing protease CtpA/Prc